MYCTILYFIGIPSSRTAHPWGTIGRYKQSIWVNEAT